MGDALIVTTVPEENLSLGAIWAYDASGEPVRLADYYGDKWIGRRRRELLARHPDAYYQLEIAVGDIWQPPAEPVAAPDVIDRTHGAAVRRSLYVFLNERLARLSRMLRTGRWVLGRARVRVVTCERLK